LTNADVALPWPPLFSKKKILFSSYAAPEWQVTECLMLSNEFVGSLSTPGACLRRCRITTASFSTYTPPAEFKGHLRCTFSRVRSTSSKTVTISGCVKAPGCAHRTGLVETLLKEPESRARVIPWHVRMSPRALCNESKHQPSASSMQSLQNRPPYSSGA